MDSKGIIEFFRHIVEMFDVYSNRGLGQYFQRKFFRDIVNERQVGIKYEPVQILEEKQV